MNKTLYIIIVLLLASLTAYPQGNNAVNITIMGSGSYSSKLSDFYTSSNAGMLTVIIRNQDYKEAQIPVQLFMSITHSFDKQPYITTKNPNPTRIINLKSNDALVLTGKDLECLFNTAYLTYKGPNLKDGSNILKIYARDIRTGKVVSNTASLSLRSVTIQPPRLVSPDNRLVYETDNQFMTFRWKGDDTYKAVTHNYVYCLEIWRQMSDNPYVDTIRTPEIITADNLKTENYQLALPMYPMEIGGRYCWRVRAHDPSGRATFSQNGWSEVRSFTYKHLPVPVTGLTHTIKQTTRRATVTWDAAEGHTKYYIEYYNPQTQKTISNTTAEPRYELAAAPDSEYKILFRVKAQCWGDDSRTSDWTPWDTIKYAARQRVESEYECGHKFPHVDITNFDLKTDFEEGDIVSEANGSSNYEIINYTADPDGTLRGQFYLVMDAWGGAKIACEFWDTKVNTDNVVITTRYRSIDLPGYVANPDEIQRYVKSLWLDANSVATSSKIRDTIVIKEKFDYLYTAADGTLYAVVVNSDGTTTETEVRTNKNTSQCLITDGQGDSLVISQKGQPMGIKEYRATGGNKALLKEYHRKSDSLAQWQINFTKYNAQTYAFDHIGSGDHGIFATDEYYPKSGNYDFRYKSVECGQTDRVIVDFGSYSEKDSVIFKDKYGVKLKVVDGNILAFTGVSKADTNYIYAYRGDQKIGKLFLNTYQKKTYKVVLISVNGAKLPNVKDLENYLNKVYRQCADSFKIETRDLQVSGIENFTHGGTKVAGSVWNASQKAVLEAFGEKYEDNTAYLFFIPKAETGGVAGYMPRYYPYGFIYPGAANRTIAHELGHGIAGLEHPFPESQVSGSTQNLMDYRDGEELWHFQWDMLQDPARKIFKWWQNEEDAEAFDLGANIVCITDEEIQKIKATQRYFFIADGRVVDLKDYNPSGFYTKDDKTESARGAVAKIRIDGYDYGMYYNKDTKQVSFFGYNTDPDHAAKKVEVAKLIVDDPEKIKLAQRVFPSDNTCDCKNFVTPENNVFKTLYAEMSEEDYTQAVERLVSRLNAQVEKENYLAVDGDADQSNEAKDYRDRLEVFHSATNNSIYVDVCCFNKKPTAEQISKMAKDVFEKSTLKDDDKSIYLVLPVWSEHKIKNDLRSYDKQYFSRSLYSKSPKYSGIKDHDNYKNITGNPIEVIDKIYRLVPKPHISISYFVTCEGNIVRGIDNDNQNVTGYPFIYDFNLWYDKALSTFADLTLKINSYRQHIQGYTTPQSRNNYYTVNDLAKSIERRDELVNKETIDTARVNHGIKQSALKLDGNGDCKTAEEFVIWFVKHEFGRSYSLDDDIFIIGKNQVEYDETLTSIDALGALLMPAKLDFIADAIGCIYTGYYGEWSDVALYSVGFVAIGVSGGVVRKVFSKKSKIVWEGNNSVKIIDQAENPIVKPAIDISAPDKLMTNILADVKNNYDDLFRDYFKHLDPETLAKFDKPMLDAWHSMMVREMPEAWCKDINIVEMFNNPQEQLFKRWDDLQSYTNKPKILLKDFDKFTEFNKQMAYTFKRMNELNAPTHWLADYDYVKWFNAHHERSCEFLKALSDNKIIIDDFDSFKPFVEYAEKYSINSISFANLGKTMHYADSRLTEKVVAEYIRTLKSPLTRDLPPNTFRAMVGDFEHIDDFSNFKVKDIENLFGWIHESEVRNLLEHTTLEVRSSGKYLAKDKIKAFVAGCLSKAASKLIIWRFKEINMSKDLNEFFVEITTNIFDPKSDAYDFWGDVLKEGIANTSKKYNNQMDCLTNVDYGQIYADIIDNNWTSVIIKPVFNCFVGYWISKFRNCEFTQEEMLTMVFNNGMKISLWTQPLEDYITNEIKDLEKKILE